MPDGYTVTDEQKEACAVSVMRAMLEDRSLREGTPFEEALEDFAESRCYEMLFDYGTRLWAEGPDYLCSLYDDETRMSGGRAWRA